MMASSLLRLTRSFVPFRPAALAVSAHPQLNIHSIRQHSTNTTQTRQFSSPSEDAPPLRFDLWFLASQMKIMSGVPSMLLTLVNDEEVTVSIPGMEKMATDLGPCVTLQMPKLGEYDQEVVRPNYFFQDDNLLLIFKTSKVTQLAAIKFPENAPHMFHMRGISNGRTDITFLGLENTNFLDPFVIHRPTPYCVAFDRSFLGKKLCEIIANSGVKSKSFTVYKKDTDESMYIKGNMPGVEKIAVNKEGLCVSLNMPGFELEDVESGFEYDTFIIEGKRENEHYIAGIRVPEGFKREPDMIKREMQDGLFKATLPHANVNRLAFSAYRYIIKRYGS